MDLHQNTETSWHQEKMELLDQFDNERKEWESQWEVMQKKIEELCHEVKLRRKMNTDGRAKILDQKANQAGMVDCSPSYLGLGQCELTGMNSRGGLGKGKKTAQSLPSAANQICQEQKVTKKAKVGFLGALASESLKGSEDLKTSKDERESCPGALNTALEELARASEDLCNFQEEIRKRSNHSRMKSDSFLQEIPEFLVPDRDRTIGSEKRCLPVSLGKGNQQVQKNPFWTDVLPSGAVETCAADAAPLQRNKPPPLPPPRSTSRNLPTAGSEQVHESLKENFIHGSWVFQESPGEWNSGPHSSTPACQNAGKTQSNCATFSLAQTDSSPLHDGNAGLRVWPCDFDVGSKSGPESWFQKAGSAPRKLTCETVTPDHLVRVHPDLHRNRDSGSSVTQNSGPLRKLSCGPEGTTRNEKLAAKTDEFNRTVFRTDRQSRVLQPGYPKSDALQPCHALISPRSENSIASDASKTRAHMPVSRGNVPCNLSQKCAAGLVRQGQGHWNPSSYRPLFSEHDWQPHNLSGRPRSADPRSNYGVVEKLLKTYKPATGPAMHDSKCSQDNGAQCDSDVFGATSSWHLEMLEQDLLQKTPARPRQATQGIDWNESREGSRTEEPSPGRGFPRPARPANRRLPSRWASRSPSAPPALRRTASSHTTSLPSEASRV